MHNCTLCSANTEFFFADKKRTYVRCAVCSAVMVLPQFFISAEEEKKRYDFHNNDTDNIGYLQYIQPIANEVLSSISISQRGLDFGSGPNSGIHFLLKQADYVLESYDPFFDNDSSKLQQKYDYIIVCEVAEHFKEPAKEFELLGNLLKPGGKLFIMTRLLTDDVDFSNWFYKNDRTHVFFYTPQTFELIAEHFNFNLIKIENRLMVLQKN